MPLVRIDVIEGRRTPEQLRAFADTVQEVMLDVFAAPPRDRYQVVTEHRPGQLICEDTGLGFERTDDLVVIQVFQQGRDAEQKRALYAALASRLQAGHGLAPDRPGGLGGRQRPRGLVVRDGTGAVPRGRPVAAAC